MLCYHGDGNTVLVLSEVMYLPHKRTPSTEMTCENAPLTGLVNTTCVAQTDASLRARLVLLETTKQAWLN